MLETGRGTRGRRLEVHGLDLVALLAAVADEVAEVLEGDLALLPDLDGLLAARAQLLDALLQLDAEVVGGHAEDLAHRGRDAGRVVVDVVRSGQLG